MSQKIYPMLLSICIPSYNRGHRAVDLVNSLLKMDCICERDYIEIVVSDNGSDQNTAGYETIKDMDDSHVVYSRNEANLNFRGNYNKVIKLSRGKYSLLISDEDKIDEDALGDLIMLLEDQPDIGILKSRTSIQYVDYKAGYAKAGYDALKEFFLEGNYISGTIYNRDYVTDELIDGLESLYKEEVSYEYYPHLYVEGFVLNLADFFFYNELLIIEGDTEHDKPILEEASVLPFSSWESRNDQLHGYLRLIKDLQVDDVRTQFMIRAAVWRTIWLIGIARDKYVSSGISWGSVVESAGKAILTTVSCCDIPVVNSNMSEYLNITTGFIKKELL